MFFYILVNTQSTCSKLYSLSVKSTKACLYITGSLCTLSSLKFIRQTEFAIVSTEKVGQKHFDKFFSLKPLHQSHQLWLFLHFTESFNQRVFQMQSGLSGGRERETLRFWSKTDIFDTIQFVKNLEGFIWLQCKTKTNSKNLNRFCKSYFLSSSQCSVSL